MDTIGFLHKNQIYNKKSSFENFLARAERVERSVAGLESAGLPLTDAPWRNEWGSNPRPDRKAELWHFQCLPLTTWVPFRIKLHKNEATPQLE